MEQFLERHNLSNLPQEEINYANWPISMKVIERIINNFFKQKAPDPDVFIGKFYQTFKKKNYINCLWSLSEYRSGENT